MRPSPVLAHRFAEAAQYACMVHRHQARKGSAVPYISHLLGVAAIVIDDGGSEDAAIAALLHDAPEDRGGRRRLADIRRRFGGAVADIVAACSDTLESPKPPWRARKERYLRHLREETRPDVLRVSAADKLYNARAVLADFRSHRERLWARFRGGREGTLWYYSEVCRVLSSAYPGALTRELVRIVSALRRDTARNHGRVRPAASGRSGAHARRTVRIPMEGVGTSRARGPRRAGAESGD